MVAKRITELISAWQAFLKSARAAHSQTGKSIGSQFWECRRLRYGFGKLSRSDYYDYRLFDDALTFADKQRFVGFDTGFHINATLNKATWKVFADDKLAAAIVENPMLNGQCIRLDAGQRFAPR